MVSNVKRNKIQFGFTILGSGSMGNATVVHCPGGNLLIDVGFTAKEIHRRLEQNCIEPASIKALLITHEHEDHVKGCRVFADKYCLGVYLTGETCRAMTNTKFLPEKRIFITPGSSFELLGTVIEPFSVPHDVADPVAYVIRCGTLKLGYATDLGCLTLNTMNKLRDCDALILESNYDPDSLKNSTRPIHIKRRIMSKHGHLSNTDAMNALDSLLSQKTKELVFAHLSRDCNSPEIVRILAETRLRELERPDIGLRIASQFESLETCWLS